MKIENQEMSVDVNNTEQFADLELEVAKGKTELLA